MIDRLEERRQRRSEREAEREARRQAIEEREEFEGLQVETETQYYEEVVDRSPGDTNIVKFGFDLHPQVTFVSAGFFLVFLTSTLVFSEQAEAFFSQVLNFLGANFGWFYVLVANIFLVATLLIGFSKFGRIRIGGPDAKPEFSNFVWYSMLVSAGIGVGLMFWGVAEPMYHFQSPAPYFGVEAESVEAAEAALVTTYLHWGFHGWAIYALIGLALAFFTFNRGLPLTIRSVFYPLLGDRIYGFWGNLIDILAVISTLFGLATSLGIGVTQVSAGLNFLFGVPDEVWVQVLLIAFITGIATISVVAGLDGGVAKLSKWNFNMAGVFLVFIIVFGPTVFIVGSFMDASGAYLSSLPRLGLWTESVRGETWQTGWTVFYYGWWISWGPFVGTFIARVSKGRTVREFIVSVVLLPTVMVMFWMAALGGSALDAQLSGARDIAGAVNENISTALFELLEVFPFTSVVSFISVILIVSWFVTSSDSGSLVVDHLTSGGKLESPVPQRIFWAIMEGTVAAILLVGGGLIALQSATVAAGIVFALVILVALYSLKVAFEDEMEAIEDQEEKEELERLSTELEALRASEGSKA